MVNVRLLCTCFAGFSAGISSFAQLWDGEAGTGAYGTGRNWLPNQVPGNATISFNGANANNQYTVNLGGTRTVAGIIFISATGANPFDFTNGTFLLGSSGIVNNDADTQVFDSTLSLSASQTWNVASGSLMVNGDVDIGSNTLTVQGANNVTLGDTTKLLGSGTLIKTGSGAFNFQYVDGNFSGALNVQQGSVGISYSGSMNGLLNAVTVTGGEIILSPTADFRGFKGAVLIDGGTFTLAPGVEINKVMNNGSLTFGSNGAVLNLASQLSVNAQFGPMTINSSANTPAIVRYGSMANSSGAFGWDSAAHALNVADGDLLGSGALKFELSNGAMVNYKQANFGGSINFSGVSGGNAAAGSAATTVGRLGFDSQSTFTFTSGLTFNNSMQVTAIGGARTVDANITIASGETAFQGRAGGTEDLTIGATVGGRTLTVKDGAAATFDTRFRDDSATIGGVTLNANTLVEAGGALNFRQSVSGGTVDAITVNGDITGQGTSAKESVMRLGLGSGASGVNFATGAGTAGSDLIVNGSGVGGLRVEGTQARVDNLITSQRIQDLTGSGGTLTIAYSDNVTKQFTLAPSAGSNVRLGFDAQDASSPLYQLGSNSSDLSAWGGLVVKGGTVRAMSNESFAGSSSQTTSLDLLGGNLILNSGPQARTLTFEGGANLTGGVLDGGANAGSLVIGGDLVHGTTTLANSPNITMNVALQAAISGSDIVGAGIVTKRGAGTVTLQTGLTATRIDIDAGTLLVGGNNLIGNNTGIRLNGGTLGINGQSDTVGALTLAANSTIDFGASGSSSWIFANSAAQAWANGSTLTIVNWDGQWFGGGSDQLVFGNLGASQLAQIRFLNPGGVQGLFNARILANGEIVPVPEPATIGFGALLLGSLGFRERKRLSGFFAALRKKSAS